MIKWVILANAGRETYNSIYRGCGPMNEKRRRIINDSPLNEDGDYVLYWMQHTQRSHDNKALDEAVDIANRLKKPLTVLFVVDSDYPDANERHFTFMLEGLKTLRRTLSEMGAAFEVRQGAFLSVLKDYIKDACALVIDKSYLRPLRTVKDELSTFAAKQRRHTVEIESDVIVPVEVASNKLEYAARTLRPKLKKHVGDFLDLSEVRSLEVASAGDSSLLDRETSLIVGDLGVTDIPPSPYFTGGEKEALARLHHFLDERLAKYHKSNDPSSDLTSLLSPYFHFGQLSPVKVYLEVRRKGEEDGVPDKAVEAFLEQLLVRRELAFNFVYYNKDGYDDFDKMTVSWAQKTMAAHADDPRPILYDETDYLAYRTHDPYFNAAMRQMVKTGHMHNTMRMYWGKKIIEWSASFKDAYDTILKLNNDYFIDGRDPVSYASVAWCFGRHDQAWKERSVFGKLRYMNKAGLDRKYDMEDYVEKTE